MLKEAAVCQSEKHNSEICSPLCRAAQAPEVQALKLGASATL